MREIEKVNRYARNAKERMHILFSNQQLSFLEKLRLVSHLRLRPAHAYPILRQWIKQDELHGKYFLCGRSKIFFEPDYTVQDFDYYLEGIMQVLWETWIRPLFFHGEVHLQQGDTCLDLGASLGTTSILFSNIVGPKGTIYAFEPLTHELLRKNLAANGIKNVGVMPYGISCSSGKTLITMSDYCLDSSITRTDWNGRPYSTKEIELTNLDSIIAELSIPRIDFIKMDIEGAEEWAILGADRLIREHYPKWSISSYHKDYDNEPQHPKLVALLRSYGYCIKQIQGYHIYAWKS